MVPSGYPNPTKGADEHPYLSTSIYLQTVDLFIPTMFLLISPRQIHLGLEAAWPVLVSRFYASEGIKRGIA